MSKNGESAGTNHIFKPFVKCTLGILSW